MKKIFTYVIRRKIQWPSKRCPNCNNGWIDLWEQVDPDAYEDNDSFPLYHAKWFVKCPNCGLRTNAFHDRKNAWKEWKYTCKTGCGVFEEDDDAT